MIIPQSTETPLAVFLMGPTASGKSQLALKIAQHISCEIINVDSALVYRDMNIGTGKPATDTLSRTQQHLIDLIDPTESYSAARFREDALSLMSEISARGKIPLLVGGTMLYFKALSEGLSDLPEADPATRAVIDALAKESGWAAMHKELERLDPATAERLDPADTQRIQRAMEVYYLTGKPMSELFRKEADTPLPYRVIKISLVPNDRAVLHQRIADRFSTMLSAGLIDEVRNLRRRYLLKANMPSMRCVGYRQTWQHLDREFNEATLKEKAVAATRQLAKRQLTWLRSTQDLKSFDCFADDLNNQVICYLRESIKEKEMQ